MYPTIVFFYFANNDCIGVYFNNTFGIIVAAAYNGEA